MSAIRAVTFDLWETLIHDSPALGNERSQLRVVRLTEALRALEQAIDVADVQRAYDASMAEYDAVWRDYRDLSTRQQLEILAGLIGEQIAAALDEAGWEAVERAYVDPIHERPPTLSPHALPVLDWLRERGYRLGLISNTGRTPGTAMRQVLADYGLLDRFDVTIFSNEEGLLKPRRELFDRAASRLGVPNEAVVHVGDNPVADVAGAKAAGMRAILLGTLPAAVAPDARIATLAELPAQLEQWGAPPASAASQEVSWRKRPPSTM
ncbi:MAG: HAD family hydrolase [Chloroflexota bacterium]|nr:HAD family hydrolase [Dehalococcoidia bacterium]MDW8253701.1 HAD family hydrolase [Chloroflexota bacterium]